MNGSSPSVGDAVTTLCRWLVR